MCHIRLFEMQVSEFELENACTSVKEVINIEYGFIKTFFLHHVLQKRYVC